jgi:hypothetical protein
MMLALLAPPVAAAADVRGVADEPCPPGAIAVEPGASIQAAVDRAVRDNVLRYNGFGHRKWFWGAEILVAASQDVEVYGNTLTAAVGGCGIVLADLSRPMKNGGKYKTRNNTVRSNQMHFERAACAGRASDAKPGDENFAIITDGNNVFDSNVYRVSRTSGPARFVWGHAIFDWDGLRRKGVELNGDLVIH